MKLSPHLIPLTTSLRVRSLERAPHAPASAKPSEAPASRLSAYHRDSFERTSATRRDLPALNVPPARLANQPVNEAAEAQAKQQWRGDDSAVAQTTDTDCGEASLTQLNKAKGSGPSSVDAKRDEVRASEASARRAVQDRFDVNLVDGARPEEIGATLGSMGVGVTRGLTNYDPVAISDALKSGQFGMAMVDSQTLANSALPPEQRKEGTGALHWVTIDGYNHGELSHDPMDDKFRVKDPVNGSYWVGAKDLLKAMDVARIEHKNNGGMLLLENRPDVTTDAQREALARSNAEQTESLGKGNGIGSKRLSASESS
ncbi:hypothetical protein JY651_26855 [Pyxidicoccus parkwayensis]|uniref:Peptidase C39-like domain-containing protein n=1 Tax=Pyxidicoccus parkwayensis TaxID=2813578 RepID=A0ABX7NJF4_9BACT|nr:hypothetical protein [Pyxidicoccus parkwaysis]QSQ18971.1 hypothetical protein JY651_26855 [Pyxidicoccus parkwaysis]